MEYYEWVDNTSMVLLFSFAINYSITIKYFGIIPINTGSMPLSRKGSTIETSADNLHLWVEFTELLIIKTSL